MKNNMSLTMGYEIHTTKGPVLKPEKFSLWDQNSHFSDFTPQPPFRYMNDAIFGLAFHQFHQFKGLSFPDKTFAEQAFKALDPYAELYQKSSQHLKPLFKNSVQFNEKTKKHLASCELFEKSMGEFWDKNITANGIDFTHFNEALKIIGDFETQLEAPLIYNFSPHFSERFTQQLMGFYSLLFHLRTLIALDHNAHVDDTVFEGVRCDSISDYLPKSDFTVNDALLYWQFKKLSTPFVGHKDKDIRIEKLFVDPMERAFFQYNHNACALVEQLPQSLLTHSSQTELEDLLHRVQMDWLLGTSTGLLFRIREEIYGICHGYDKVFWPETSHRKNTQSSSLKICFELTEADVFGNSQSVA